MKKMDTRTIATLGVLVALHIILSRFFSINAWNIKIGFAFVPVFLAAWVYGPVSAALVGGLGDFLGAILFPIGPYFPGFTLSCVLMGVIFGVLLHKEQTMPRILAAVALEQFGVSLFLTTLWISMLYGSPYPALLSVRVVQAALLSTVEFMVISVFSRGTVMVRQALANRA